MADTLSTQNLDIHAMSLEIDKIIYELNRSQSAGVTAWSQHDLTRLAAYQADLKARHDWMISQPGSPMDAPATHPHTMAVHVFTDGELAAMDNTDINVLIQHYAVMKIELVKSQSSRLMSGLLSHDSRRWTEIWNRINAYIAQVISPSSPRDMPESTPAFEPVQPGLTG